MLRGFATPYRTTTEPYLSNPYTNVDVLVKRLLGEDGQTIDWANLGQTVEWQLLEIQVDAENEIFLN